jgi:hypothetical protein
MIDEKEFYNNNLTLHRWVGIVVNNKDPESEGRIKVRVFGVHGNPENTENGFIRDQDLPWCYPANHTTSGSGSGGSFYSVPKINSMVEVKFLTNDPYSLIYTRQLHISDEVRGEIAGDENAHVLWYDSEESMKIFYTQSKGIIFYLKGTFINLNNEKNIIIKSDSAQCQLQIGNNGEININADNINVVASEEMRQTTPLLNLEGADTNIGVAPVFSAVSAEILWTFLKALSATCDSKWPPTPGAMSALAEAAEQASTSRTVKISL